MRSCSGTTSVWRVGAPEPLRPLESDAETDVVVVGAGIAGLSVAHALVERGKRVIVLDDGPIGHGETIRTTAHLVTALDERYEYLDRMHGGDAARLAAQSHGAAIDRIEALADRLHADCGFLRVPGYLFVPDRLRESRAELIERELAAATRAGVQCEPIDFAPGLGVDSGRCLRFPRQAQFHPMRYIHGLAAAIERGGGRIHTGSHVAHVEGGSAPRATTSDNRVVRAGAIVVATNTPVNDRVTMHTKQVAYRTYVLGLRIPRRALSPALYWDGYWGGHDEDPYHYVRLALSQPDSDDTLIVGGEDHPTGRDPDPDHRYERLERWARKHFPTAAEVVCHWSGQVMEPHDELAFIGAHPRDNGVFIVTGDSGNGMTYSTIAAIMLPDLVAGLDHPWKSLYSPSRLPRHAPAITLEENIRTLSEYRDWVTSHPKSAVDGLKPGEGVVARIHGRLRAIYKRSDGTVSDRSAVCPHLYGIVRWNPSEHSWDCPCHGSRFDCEGRVITGPANGDLPAEDPPADG